MKKKTVTTVVCLLGLAVFANCGKKEDNPNKGASDMSATCYLVQTNSLAGQNTQVANPNNPCAYNYSSNSGFQSLGGNGYSLTSGTYVGYTGGSTPSCGTSMTLVYSPSKGLGCVSNTQINLSGQVAVYDFNRTSLTFTLISTPNSYYQYNQPNYYNGTGITGSQVLRVCDVGAEPCPNGQYCRSPLGPQAPAGAIGLCYF